jgi:Ran GTPase-activating protein (RanGAP) involved in mRNA processing and transport
VLNVSNNLISPSGMKALCRALSFCQSVTTLNVAWNDIRDRGVLALIKVLRAPNCRITDLDVSYNQISGDATAKLVRTLQKNARATPTKRLNMAGNNFAAEHVPLLVKVLNSRTQPLTHLNLSDMNCRKLWKICMALSDRNRALQWLCLSKNGIHFFKVGNAEEFASRMLGESRGGRRAGGYGWGWGKG